jgi:hypothetical protein
MVGQAIEKILGKIRVVKRKIIKKKSEKPAKVIVLRKTIKKEKKQK